MSPLQNKRAIKAKPIVGSFHERFSQRVSDADAGMTVLWGTRFGPRLDTNTKAGSSTDAAAVKQANIRASESCKYIPASVAATQGIVAKKRGRPSGEAEKFVPGEGVLRLGVPSPATCTAESVTAPTSLSNPKRAGRARKGKDAQSHHALAPQSVPANRPSTSTDATATATATAAKPRHSNDPVVVQNRQHRRRKAFLHIDDPRKQYVASLRLAPISEPQHGPLPPIGILTGAFRHRPRYGATLTDSLVSAPALITTPPARHSHIDLDNDSESRGTAGPSSASRPAMTTPSGHRSTGHSLTSCSPSSPQRYPATSELWNLSALASACTSRIPETSSPVERTSSSSSRAHARWHSYHATKVAPCPGTVHSKDL
ncbi:hypothetical protein C8Q72DRAFT_167310 [Fomitopsis betulina]|nr:hypothetical protein C8Q72DRAFT_167310 [Fomitopsis betulina]